MGLLIIAAGVLFTLDNLGVADADHLLRYWPAALIAIGLLKLWHSHEGRAARSAVSCSPRGHVAAARAARASIRISFWDMWPMLLVFFGGYPGLAGRPAAGDALTTSDSTSTISAMAMLGGVSRGNNSRDFRGGELTAILGGCEIDLRQAAIDGEAVIDVFAMWGGIEIRVPEDWTVVSRVTPTPRRRRGQDAPAAGRDRASPACCAAS